LSNTESSRQIIAEILDASPELLKALEGRYASDPRAGVQAAFVRARKAHERAAAALAHAETLYSEQLAYAPDAVVVGVDEVGRGPLAGPLTVGAVVLPSEPKIIGLNDSKQLSDRARRELASQVRAIARGLCIVHIEPGEIDTLGITACLRKAMAAAIDGIALDVDAVLIDGNPIGAHAKERNIVKGDAKVASIAAASIVAKVERDDLMIAYDGEYPGYGFASNKGYGSQDHIAAIRKLGLTSIHRTSFCTAFAQPSLF
jgi:ribonuclease HII